MAVTITDNRTVVNEADATTGWSSSNGVAVFTTAPDPVESTGSLGTQVSNATEEAYFTITAADLSNTIVYAWLLPGGVLDTTTNGGTQVIIGDGTNRIGYHVGGSDGAGFRHNTGPVTWQCFAIDTSSLPVNSTAFAGTAGSLNTASIQDIGGAFKTLAKSVGGVENCFVDILFYGTGGLTITGGGAGTEGKFIEIAQRDRSTADHPGTGVASATGGGYGICRELGTDLIGLQGPLTFGDSAGTLSVDFEDTGQTVVFEDNGFATDKYGYTITGNTTGTTSFILGVRDGIGLGSSGCSLVTPAGVGAFFTASSANIDTLGLYGCSLSGFTQGVTFTTDGTAGPNHEIFATSFSGCGQIIIGTTEFKNNSISGTTDATAAVLLEDTTNVSDLTFTGTGSEHAIVITDATNSPFTFTNFTYTGYDTTLPGSNLTPGTGPVNATVYNNTGTAITINIVGGDAITVRNAPNSTTTVNNNINITVTGLKDNTEVRVFLTSTLDDTPPYSTPTEVAGIENATAGTTNNRTFTFTIGAGTGITIRTFNENWIADDITITPNSTQDVQVAQRQDRVFSNP